MVFESIMVLYLANVSHCTSPIRLAQTLDQFLFETPVRFIRWCSAGVVVIVGLVIICCIVAIVVIIAVIIFVFVVVVVVAAAIRLST